MAVRIKREGAGGIHSQGTSGALAAYEGWRQTGVSEGNAGAQLKPSERWKGPTDKPALKPYRGKPAVRNFRGGGGNVGIIRSPVRATTLPDIRKRWGFAIPKGVLLSLPGC
jgi:hypothetical protein